MRAVLVAVVLTLQPLGAQTVLHWLDGTRAGSTPAAAVLMRQGEVWVFNYDHPADRRLEIGNLWAVGQNWHLGGYGVVWPQSGRLAVLPWAQYSGSLPLGAQLNANLATYIPLGRGSMSVLADPVSLTWKLPSGWGVGGVASLWWPTDGQPELRAGPVLQKRFGNLDLSLRWQPLEIHGIRDPVWRLETAVHF